MRSWSQLYTRMRAERSGQLALMDALVFLAIALLICSVQLASLAHDVERESALSERMCRTDPSCLLRVLLPASIGIEVTVPIDGGLIVSASSAVSESLAAEAAAVIEGFDAARFDELNLIMLAIAENLAHPLFEVHLLLTLRTYGDSESVVRIEREPPRPSDIAAASSILADCKSWTAVVTLLLQPALLPEGRSV